MVRTFIGHNNAIYCLNSVQECNLYIYFYVANKIFYGKKIPDKFESLSLKKGFTCEIQYVILNFKYLIVTLRNGVSK